MATKEAGPPALGGTGLFCYPAKSCFKRSLEKTVSNAMLGGFVRLSKPLLDLNRMPPSRRRGGARMFNYLPRPVVAFVQTEDGPTSVEYAIVIALIVVTCFVAVTTLGSSTAKS